MSEVKKPCRLEQFIGQKVRVSHERFSGVGVLSRVEAAREPIAWVTLEHGEDRWYEASTVLPVQYTQKPIECDPDQRQHTEAKIIAAFWKALDATKVGSGSGNAILYCLLENLNR